MTYSNVRPGRALAGLALIATLAAACDEGATTPEVPVGVSLSSVAVGPELEQNTTIVGSTLVQTDANGTLVIEVAQVVIKSVELEGDGDLQEFEKGPMLLDLALDGAVEQELAETIPAGVYDELEFEIDKADDQEFLALNPDFADVSVLVEGQFDDAPFVLTLDIDEETEIDLDPPLTVTEGETPNLTLMIDVSQWFLAVDGSVIDPRTAGPGGANEGLVKENIKRSIQAFEDDDRDGDRG